MSQDRLSALSSVPTLSNNESYGRNQSPEGSFVEANNTANVSIYKTPDPNKRRNQDGSLVRSSTISSGTKSPVRRHFRNMSISSVTSTVSQSNINSARKGINLGISLISSPPVGGSVQKDGASTFDNVGDTPKEKNATKSQDKCLKTPRRQLFNKDPLSSPSLEDGKTHNEEIESRSSIDTNNTDISLVMHPSPTPVASSKDELSDKLRLLASKEMEVLEIKNQLKDLMQKKRDKEFELQQLKMNIEKQLMSNLTQKNNERKVEHVPKSPSSKKRALKLANSTIDPLLDDSFISVPTRGSDDDNLTAGASTAGNRQSWFAKPLNFIQQFDNMIYKELEKLQVADDEDLDSLVDMNYTDDAKQETLTNKEINAPIKSLAVEKANTSNDVMQSVSQHLWSFVNDVKSNLLIEEEDIEPVLAASSPEKGISSRLSREVLTNPKTRLRTASISKRQSYSQHNLHKKRPSMTIVKDEAKDVNNNDSFSREFNKSNISDVVRTISKNENPELVSGANSAEELKSASRSSSLSNMLDDTSINESDLWENEPLDI